MRSSQFGRSPPLGQYWLSVFWLCVFLKSWDSTKRFHAVISQKKTAAEKKYSLKTLVIFAECCTPKKLIFFDITNLGSVKKVPRRINIRNIFKNVFKKKEVWILLIVTDLTKLRRPAPAEELWCLTHHTQLLIHT